ncbi:molybdopterin-guanine dinucleotide biosynthesis protein B [Thioalkalivibrio sp. K90mix]|uniref:molybdopterin-guanine dinucleotide biosynthesis protein B n=1 Tax=Thioalkalivibrio sp. (strain K90mix) TaxID=396595 RepID=UPI000195954B|nr:molybdopterin-guanine dinucleotide biosynthesis protein B [Thioalkalivibrio sp. K90mix]ADC72598.1 molybdopterin-guanine dinucleotide biosynthesis protein B [Thioalkalivibrio sp. K90mix]
MTPHPFNLPRIGFAAWSGSGKTTLLKAVIPALRARGQRPAVIKHAHHAFDVDTPGKDSYELRHAGADQMLVASCRRYALMVETPETDDGRVPDLDMLCSRLDPERADLILVEGFKQADLPKIEVHRPAVGKPPLYPEIPGVIAVATDAAELDFDGPLLPVNDPDAVARFIIDYCNLNP